MWAKLLALLPIRPYQMLQISQDRFIKQMEADAAKVDAMMPELPKLPELKLPEGF